MSFASFEFAAFLAVVLCVYYSLGHAGQNRLLLLASYVFYGWWDWRFCGLIALSTVVDFFCARGIAKAAEERQRKLLVTLSVVTNLTILGLFKYANFFIDSAVAVLQSIGLSSSSPSLEIILPVGISFYTFQTMAYTIDVYRRDLEPTRNFETFALYVAFFPQLVAGPIERATRLLPQLANPRAASRKQLLDGCQLILVGFVKKVAIADAVAPYVSDIFSTHGWRSSPELWLGSYLFAIQIYGDFSGYTDIARGVAKLLGVDLMVNFRQPYLSTNITEFWRRWHISLSSWLRDYVYIPLGGNRRGVVRTYVNLMLTMLLGGLWHGASWVFVIWGGMHGLYLSAHKWLVRARPGRKAVPALIRGLVTFHLVCLTWVFFRADDLTIAIGYVEGMVFNGLASGVDTELLVAFVLYASLTLILDLPSARGGRELPVPSSLPVIFRGLAYACMLLLLSFLGEHRAPDFIYFQF